MSDTATPKLYHTGAFGRHHETHGLARQALCLWLRIADDGEDERFTVLADPDDANGRRSAFPSPLFPSPLLQRRPAIVYDRGVAVFSPEARK